MPRKKKVPSYCHHKGSGQAVVRVNGQDCYLGAYGSQASLDEYNRVLAKHGLLQPAGALREATSAAMQAGPDLTINELIEAYREHAKAWYLKDGRPTSEQYCIKLAMKPLRVLFGSTLAMEFGPRALKAVREKMIADDYVRTSINRHMHRIRKIFSWAASEELLPVSIHQALLTVQGLSKGRSTAREAEPVLPVAIADVEATLPYLSRQLQSMVRLQLACGARPGEICLIRPCDVTRSTDGAWIYRPASHKTEHHGRERRVFLGPRAQSILKPWLDRDPEAYCFSPVEVRAEQDAEKRVNRKSPRTPSQEARKRKPAPRRWAKERYTKDSFSRAIARACLRRLLDELAAEGIKGDAAQKWIEENGVRGGWAPNQLRHAAATEIREQFGIEGAQLILGHSDPRITLVYAEKDFKRAAEIARQIG